MSKQQAILETLLGAAELSGNSALVDRIRVGLDQSETYRQFGGYRRLLAVAEEPKRIGRKAA
jgi:hypothetical protein